MRKRTGIATLSALSAVLGTIVGFLVFVEPTPNFMLLRDGELSGVANLDANLCINSVCETPTFRYYGGDATTSNWTAATYGETLTAAGSGGTVNNGSPYLGTDDDSVNPDGTRYWQASGNSFADVTTEDMVVEAVFKFEDTSNAYWVAKFASDAAGGWLIYRSATGRLTLYLDGGAPFTQAATGVLVDGAWYHLIWFVDASGSYVVYTNSVQGTAVATPGASLTGNGKLTIGANNTGASNVNGNIAYLAMWKRDAWLDTHLQADIAKERFQKLTGLYPQIAKGTAAWNTYTRATTAHMDKWEGSDRKLYYMGAGHPRVCYRKEKTSGADFVGYLAETAATNLCLQSADFSTTWAKIDAGDTITTDATVAPDGTTTADDLVADATDGDHGVSQAITLTAVAHVFSVWAKKGNKDWLYLSNDTVANATGYFDLANGVTGTFGAGATGDIEDWGGGLFRCWIRYTGTVAAHTHKIQSAHADTDKDFAGDGSTVNTSIWGAQIEANVDAPTSYIPTSGAAATRNADVLWWKGDDGNIVNNQQGTMEVDVLLPDAAPVVQTSLMSLNDGGSSNDRMYQYMNPSYQHALQVKAAGAATVGIVGSTDITDGDAHTIRSTWKTDDAKHYADGAADGTPDTSCAIPDDLDRIDVGMVNSASSQTNGLLRGIKIWPYVTTQAQ